MAVVGDSGSGKSMLARELARRLGADHIELDAIHHLPDWTPMERDEMRRVVSERTSGERWFVDGDYGTKVGHIVLGRADTCVWLDLPRRVVMPRIIRRTLRRGFRRQELWNGNREQVRDWFHADPQVNITLWSWKQVDGYRALYGAAMADPAAGVLAGRDRLRACEDDPVLGAAVRSWPRLDRGAMPEPMVPRAGGVWAGGRRAGGAPRRRCPELAGARAACYEPSGARAAVLSTDGAVSGTTRPVGAPSVSLRLPGCTRTTLRISRRTRPTSGTASTS